MKRVTFPAALALGLAVLPSAALAEGSPLTGRLAAYSEYEYRGIGQTAEKPALQLNLDWAGPSGLYLGTFASNVKWLDDTAEVLGLSNDAKIEVDVYGGWRHEVLPGWTLDLGALRYVYPSSRAFGAALDKPDTTELYAGVSWGPATLKYSRATTTLFGVPDSKGSDYLELALNAPVWEKLTLNLLAGRQRYKGSQPASGNFDNSLFDYTVWKAGGTWDFGRGLSVGAYVKGTDAEPAYFTLKGRDASRDRFVAFAAWSF